MNKNVIIKNIYPEYQPIFDIYNNEIVKYEALVRSKDEKGDIKYPDDIFKILDINTVTKLMFPRVIEDIKQYNIKVSFNIDLSDVKNEEVNNFILTNIQKHNIGEQLTIEFVEEKELSKEVELVSEFINKLHDLKVKVALDDFGKGYATFQPILEFNFDIIKLDKILVEKFLEKDINYFLLDTLIVMFNRLKIEMVAEYIETEDELNALKYVGCKYAQGYHIGKPAEIDKIKRD